MLRSLQIEGVGPVPSLYASFGDRLNIFTGDNGLGKSFLLDVCFWALSGMWPNGRTALPAINGKKNKPEITFDIQGKSSSKKEPKTATFDHATQTWTRPKGRPFKPGLVIYASVDGSFAVWDPARNYWRDPSTGTKEGSETPRAFQFTPETLANGLRDGERVLCEGLIQDWSNWYFEAQSKNASESTIKPFELLSGVIEGLSHPSEPIKCETPKRIYVDEPRRYPILSMPYGEVPYPNWSAGIRRVICFAYLLVWCWYEHVQAAQLRDEKPENKIILLIDEIEAHLHPRWQRTILPAILQVVQRLQETVSVQVFAATHSPLILASLETVFDSKHDKLFSFELQGQTPEFREMKWAIQGDVVGWLTSDVFGLQQARSREGEIAIEAAEAFMRGETNKLPDGLKSKAQIHAELVRVLPGLDPFWPRWIVEAKP